MTPRAKQDEVVSLVGPESVLHGKKSSSEKTSPPLRLWFSALVLSLAGGFHFGYNLVLTNPAEMAFKQFLNSSIAASNEGLGADEESLDFRWSSYVSLLYVGSFLGAFLIQPMADRLGRKRAVILSTAGQAVAVSVAILSYFLNSHIFYAASRGLLGFFQAITVGIAPMYMSECSPASCRGIISLSTGLFVQISIVFSSILASPQFLGSPSLWWALYAVELGVLVVALAALPFLPDSPSFLHSRGSMPDTSHSLSFFHGISGYELEMTMESMREDSHDSSETVGLLGLFKDSGARGRAFTGAVVMFGMIMGGIVVINAYAFRIFLTVGLDESSAAWANVGISTIMVLGVALSSLVIDRFGRRPLLLFTMSCVLLLNCVIVVLMYLFEADKDLLYGKLLIGVICVYALVFSAGPAPLSFFISAELCPQHVRGAAMTCAALIMAGGRSIVVAIYPPLVVKIHSAQAYGLLFIPATLLCIVYLFFRFPETKPETEPSKIVED